MKLKEFIELLNQIPDKDAEVIINDDVNISEATIRYVVNYTVSPEPQSTVEIWV